MNNRLRGILLLLVGFALIGVGLVAVYLLTRQAGFSFFVNPAQLLQPTTIPVVKNKVIVMARDKKLGEVIKEGDLTTLEVPVDLSPRDVVTLPNLAVGKTLRADMVQGEMLTLNKLADPTNVNRDLAFALSNEHVMMALLFNDVMTQQSIVQRGDIVDILVSTTQQVDSNPVAGAVPSPALRATPVPGAQATPVPTPRPGTEPPPQTVEGEMILRMFTFDGLQKVGVTGMVMDVITENRPASGVQAVAAPTPQPKTVVRAYLLALKPQDALILKYLKDNGAVFDIVLRAPTSTGIFELTPVTQEYIVEFYALQILK